MNLPNFINFEPFNALRRQMHTERVGHFSLGREVDPPAPAKPGGTVKAKAKRTKKRVNKARGS